MKLSSLFNWLPWRKRKARPVLTATVPPPDKKAEPLSQRRVDWARVLANAAAEPAKLQAPQLAQYQPAPGVVPAAELGAVLACDSTPYDYMNRNGFGAYSFMGYPFLAELAQVAEYRKMGSVLAEEMTREGVAFRSKDDDSKDDRIKELAEWFDRHKVMDKLRHALELDSWFGRAQLYLDVALPDGTTPAREKPTELLTPLSFSNKKIKKGGALGLNVVEPMWSYPGLYNSTDPLAADYYRPSTWYVMGKQVHSSRLLTLIGNPVPDMLKAAYSFGGVPLSQLAKPYVDNWLRTRDSVGDMIHSYSTSGIKTDMSQLLQTPDSGASDPCSQDDVLNRAALFTKMRDNRGLMVLDKEAEDFFQYNAPLGGLDKLQAQAQEQQSSVSGIPLVKLLGITPTGLNASSDGEVRVFYDSIAARQTRLLKPVLDVLVKLASLDLWGEVDDGIAYVFNPLYQLSDVELATVRKTNADTATAYITNGVISPLDERTRLANDPESLYSGLDITEGEDDEQEETDEGAAAEQGQAVAPGTKPAKRADAGANRGKRGD